MKILGISGFYHDAAACLIRDGEVVAAAQQEGFTRKKHDHEFPKHAVDYCLEAAGVTPAAPWAAQRRGPLTRSGRAGGGRPGDRLSARLTTAGRLAHTERESCTTKRDVAHGNLFDAWRQPRCDG